MRRMLAVLKACVQLSLPSTVTAAAISWRPTARGVRRGSHYQIPDQEDLTAEA